MSDWTKSAPHQINPATLASSLLSQHQGQAGVDSPVYSVPQPPKREEKLNDADSAASSSGVDGGSWNDDAVRKEQAADVDLMHQECSADGVTESSPAFQHMEVVRESNWSGVQRSAPSHRTPTTLYTDPVSKQTLALAGSGTGTTVVSNSVLPEGNIANDAVLTLPWSTRSSMRSFVETSRRTQQPPGTASSISGSITDGMKSCSVGSAKKRPYKGKVYGCKCAERDPPSWSDSAMRDALRNLIEGHGSVNSFQPKGDIRLPLRQLLEFSTVAAEFVNSRQSGYDACRSFGVRNPAIFREDPAIFLHGATLAWHSSNQTVARHCIECHGLLQHYHDGALQRFGALCSGLDSGSLDACTKSDILAFWDGTDTRFRRLNTDRLQARRVSEP